MVGGGGKERERGREKERGEERGGRKRETESKENGGK